MKRAAMALALAVLLALPAGGAECEGRDAPAEEYDPAWDVPATEYAYLDVGEPLGEFVLSAYCPCSKCCGRWADGITATGTVATEGRTIAVDPSVIPYGATVTLYCESGDTVSCIAEDCGGGIKGKHIDVFFDDHQAALEFGVQSAMVYVEVRE